MSQSARQNHLPRSRIYLNMIMNSFFCVLLISSFPLTINAQVPTYEWTRIFSSPANDYSTSTTTDNTGNVVTIGDFTNTVDFDPGPAVYNLTSVDHFDIFILKLNSSGNFIWAKSIGGTGADLSVSVKTDNSGNTYIAGSFMGTVDFDPGPGTYNLTGGGSFILKLDVNGNFLWVKQWGNTDLLCIETDASGNLYATGGFYSIADLDPGPAVYNLTEFSFIGVTTLIMDVFVLKLDAAGNFQWAKQMGGIQSEFAYSIDVDAAGNCLTTGSFGGTADFDPGSGTNNLVSAGLTDVFISKIDLNGNFVWAKRIGGILSDYSRDIATDPLGNVYLGGNFFSTADFDPGQGIFNMSPSSAQGDIFILKLNASGLFAWAKQITGPANELLRGLTVDNFGNVYSTGYYENTVDFDPGPGTFNMSSSGYQDSFISILDNNGNFRWVGSTGYSINYDAGFDIHVDQSRNIYSVGMFWITSANFGDAFIQKFSQCSNITYSTINAFSCNTYTLNNQVYNSSGTYTQTLINSGGCDSVITLILVIGGSNSTTNTAACDSYLWEGQTYTVSGAYTRSYIDMNGCDSILNLNLTINNSVATNIQATICEGQSYAGHTVSGVYIDTYTTSNGCDSIRTLDLTVNVRSYSTINATICEGQVFAGHSTQGVHRDTLVAANGCDSIRTLNLTVNPRMFTTVNASICEGETFVAGGAPQTVSGIYRDTLHTYLGCDSVIATNLTVNPKPRPNLGPDKNVCEGNMVTIDPGIFNAYLWHDMTTLPAFTTNITGLYWVKVTSMDGCIGSDTISIAVENCLKGLFVPSAFTPNGDTKNDIFKPLVFGTLKKFEFRILNRYGETVFYTKDINLGWDGRLRGVLQNTAVFTWICTYQVDQQMVNTEKGTVLLLR